MNKISLYQQDYPNLSEAEILSIIDSDSSEDTPERNTSYAGDLVDSFQAGIIGLAADTAQGVTLGNENAVSRGLRDLSNSQYDTMIPESIEALNNTGINDDLSIKEGSSLRGAGLMFSQGLGSLAPSLIPGLAIGGALNKIQKAGTLTKALKTRNSVIGHGLGGAAMIGGGTANQAIEEVRNAPIEQLANSEEFKQLFWENRDNNLSEIDSVNKAREDYAALKGQEAFVPGAAIGAVSMGIGNPVIEKVIAGKAGASRLANMVAGGATEFFQEFGEGFGQQVSANKAAQDYDINRNTYDDAVGQGATGAVIGGAIGGAIGGITYRGNGDSGLDSGIDRGDVTDKADGGNVVLGLPNLDQDEIITFNDGSQARKSEIYSYYKNKGYDDKTAMQYVDSLIEQSRPVIGNNNNPTLDEYRDIQNKSASDVGREEFKKGLGYVDKKYQKEKNNLLRLQNLDMDEVIVFNDGSQARKSEIFNQYKDAGNSDDEAYAFVQDFISKSKSKIKSIEPIDIDLYRNVANVPENDVRRDIFTRGLGYIDKKDTKRANSIDKAFSINDDNKESEVNKAYKQRNNELQEERRKEVTQAVNDIDITKKGRKLLRKLMRNNRIKIDNRKAFLDNLGYEIKLYKDSNNSSGKLENTTLEHLFKKAFDENLNEYKNNGASQTNEQFINDEVNGQEQTNRPVDNEYQQGIDNQFTDEILGIANDLGDKGAQIIEEGAIKGLSSYDVLNRLKSAINIQPIIQKNTTKNDKKPDSDNPTTEQQQDIVRTNGVDATSITQDGVIDPRLGASTEPATNEEAGKATQTDIQIRDSRKQTQGDAGTGLGIPEQGQEQPLTQQGKNEQSKQAETAQKNEAAETERSDVNKGASKSPGKNLPHLSKKESIEINAYKDISIGFIRARLGRDKITESQAQDIVDSHVYTPIEKEAVEQPENNKEEVATNLNINKSKGFKVGETANAIDGKGANSGIVTAIRNTPNGTFISTSNPSLRDEEKQYHSINKFHNGEQTKQALRPSQENTNKEVNANSDQQPINKQAIRPTDIKTAPVLDGNTEKEQGLLDSESEVSKKVSQTNKEQEKNNDQNNTRTEQDGGNAGKTDNQSKENNLFKKEDIPYQLAYNAYSGSSFVPEKRAKSVQDGYVSDMQDTYDEAIKYAENDNHKAAIEDDFNYYKEGYLKRYKALLSTQSRTLSSMITGGSNFPVRSNNKKLLVVDKRRNEYLDWIEKGRASLIQKAKNGRSQKTLNDEKLNAIKKEIGSSLGVIRDIDEGTNEGMSRPLFVNSVTGKVKTMARNGEVDLVNKVLDFIEETQNGLKKPLITKRNSIWKLRDKVSEVKQQKEDISNRDTKVYSFDGGEMHLNYQDDRVRIYHNDKPSIDVRNELKSNAFRWSRKEGAWQRKLTQNSINIASRITGVTTDSQEKSVHTDKGNALYSKSIEALDKNDFSNAAKAWTELSKNSDLFRYSVSASKSMIDIANDISKNYTVEKSEIQPEGVKQSWIVKLKGDKADAKRFIIEYNDGRIELNVSQSEAGQNGSELYAIVGNYAHNNNLVFSKDRFGLTKTGKQRRLENALSLALKFNSTDFIGNIDGVKWKDGDTLFNISEMLEKSQEYTRDSIKDKKWFDSTRFNFDNGRFENSNGEEIKQGEYKKHSEQARGRGFSIGETTIKRAILTKELVSRTKNEGGISRVLDSFLPGNIPESLSGINYSKGKTSGSTVKDIEDMLPRRIKKMLGDQIEIVQSTSDISDDVVTFTSRDGIEGFYLPSDNKVYLVADNLNSNNLNATLAHELLHFRISNDTKLKAQLDSTEAGLRDLFQKTQDGTYKGRYKKLYDEALERVELANTTEDSRFEEWLAYQVTAVNEGKKSIPAKLKQLIQKLISTIKMVLRKMGIPVTKLTPQDLSSLAMQSFSINQSKSSNDSPAKFSKATERVVNAFSKEKLAKGIDKENQEKYGILNDRLGKIGELATKYFNTLDNIAKNNPVARPFLDMAKDMQMTKDNLLSDTNNAVKAYNTIGNHTIRSAVTSALDVEKGKTVQQKRLDKALFEGTLEETVFSEQELKSRFELNDKAIVAYKDIRSYMDAMTDEYKDSLLERMGIKREGKKLSLIEPTGKNKKDADRIALGYKLLKDFNELKGYFPLMRFGEHTITVRNDTGDVVYFAAEESKQKAVSHANKVKKEFDKEDTGYKVSVGFLAQNKRDDLAFDPRMLNMLGKYQDDIPGFSDIFDQVEQDILSAFSSSEFKKRFIHRKGIAGFSNDTARSLASYGWSSSNYISKMKFVPKMQTYIDEMDKHESPKTYGHLQETLDYIKKPAREYQAIKSFTFLYYMGANVKSAMVNLTQIPVTLGPYLANKFGDRNTASAIRKSLKVAAKENNDNANSKIPKTVQDYLKWAQESGLTFDAYLGELIGAATGKRAAQAQLANKILETATLLFSKAEMFNRRTSVAAAFYLTNDMSLADINTMLVEAGHTPQESKELAMKEFMSLTVTKTQFDYSKYNRPAAFRGWGSVPLQFNQFMVNYLQFLSGNGGGIGASARSLGMVVAFAGLMGLPGSDDLRAAIEYAYTKITGKHIDLQLESRKALVDAAETFMSDDAARQFAEMALYGGFSLSPIDISGSVGAGRVVPGLGDFFNTAKDKGELAGLSRFILGASGASTGIARKTFRGIEEYEKSGEISRLLEKGIPSVAIQNIMKSVRMAVQGVDRNYSGKISISYEPDTLDTIAQALSFTPGERKRLYRNKNVAYRESNFLKMAHQKLITRLSAAIAAKDKDGIREARLLIKEWNKDVPRKWMLSNDKVRRSIRSRRKNFDSASTVRTKALQRQFRQNESYYVR